MGEYVPQKSSEDMGGGREAWSSYYGLWELLGLIAS